MPPPPESKAQCLGSRAQKPPGHSPPPVQKGPDPGAASSPRPGAATSTDNVYPCRSCPRVLKTAMGLGQHERDKHLGAGPARHGLPPSPPLSDSSKAPPATVQSAAQDVAPPTPAPAHLQPSRNGNHYTNLDPSEQGDLMKKILSAHAPCEPAGAPLPETQTTPAWRGASRRAVVLGCETAYAGPGPRVLVRVSAADLLTGELLLDAPVSPPPPSPSAPAVTGRPRDGGAGRPREAVRAPGEALPGWWAARGEVWRHVGRDTVVVGHSLGGGLRALRALHPRTLDTSTLARDALRAQAAGGERARGLRELCRGLLGVGIREEEAPDAAAVAAAAAAAPSIPGGRHDGAKDVLAARELALRCLRRPDELRAWASRQRDLAGGRASPGGGGRGRGGSPAAGPAGPCRGRGGYEPYTGSGLLGGSAGMSHKIYRYIDDYMPSDL